MSVPFSTFRGASHFNIKECVDAFNKSACYDSDEQIQKEQEELQDLRQVIAKNSKDNFVFEKHLGTVDDKIKLLVRNQLDVHEVSLKVHGGSEETAHANSPIKAKMIYYQQLFHLLQNQPRYFGELAALVSVEEITLFVQTVVFDMYGDQYDTREERLLLDMFRMILEKCFDKAESMGSFLRDNTAISKMLSSYAKRGLGLGILKDILAQPLQDIVSQRNLNLEINPSEVYIQLIQSYETSTGKSWELQRNYTQKECSQLKEVRRLIKPRVKQLMKIAEHFLQRIVQGVDTIPYGIRWICKQLSELARKKFPDADRYQIGSLIGGFIYLRFFNPVIVMPDSFNFVTEKPNKIMHRNLKLIAKMLQNLSNGLLFKDKETFMIPLNKFLKKHMDTLANYFDKLIDIEDIDEYLDVDQLLVHVQKRENQVMLSYNQMFLIHSLLEQHLDEVTTGTNDPVIPILKDLGKSRPQLPNDENHTIAVRFIPRNQDEQKQQTVVNNRIKSQLVDPRTSEANILLTEVLEDPQFPEHMVSRCEGQSFRQFLVNLRYYSIQQSLTELGSKITDVMHHIDALNHITDQSQPGFVDQIYNEFVSVLVQQRIQRRKRIRNHKKKLNVTREAQRVILEHKEYLQARLDMYEKYLNNVKTGGSNLAVASKEEKKKKKKHKKESKHKIKLVKKTHQELEGEGVVIRTDPLIRKDVLKKCHYEFSMLEPGVFKVEPIYKRVVSIKVLSEPLMINLEDLLDKQAKGQNVLDLEHVGLSVNLLIHLFNQNFMGDKKKY